MHVVEHNTRQEYKPISRGHTWQVSFVLSSLVAGLSSTDLVLMYLYMYDEWQLDLICSGFSFYHLPFPSPLFTQTASELLKFIVILVITAS